LAPTSGQAAPASQRLQFSGDQRHRTRTSHLAHTQAARRSTPAALRRPLAAAEQSGRACAVQLRRRVLLAAPHREPWASGSGGPRANHTPVQRPTIQSSLNLKSFSLSAAGRATSRGVHGLATPCRWPHPRAPFPCAVCAMRLRAGRPPRGAQTCVLSKPPSSRLLSHTRRVCCLRRIVVCEFRLGQRRGRVHNPAETCRHGRLPNACALDPRLLQ